MGQWRAPLLGRQVDVVYQDLVWDEKPRHWWQSGRFHHEARVHYSGAVVDRAEGSAEYLVACKDGKMRWVWSDNLRLREDA